MTMIDGLDHPEVTPRDEIVEAINNLCHAARREMPKVGTPDLPTPWDRRHAAINDLLDEWELAPA